MSLRRHRSALSISLLCIVLAACGGGGGGESNPGTPQNPPPPQLPPPTTLALDDSNFIDSAALVFGAFTKLGLSPEAPVLGAILLGNTTAPTENATCSASSGVVGRIDFSYEDRDRTGALSAGDRLRTEYTCFGETRTILLDLSLIDVITERVEGDVQHSAVTDAGLRISGSFRLVAQRTRNGLGLRQTLSNLTLTATSATGTSTVTGGTIERMRDNVLGYEYGFAGTARTEAGREFTFSTPTRFTGNFFETPTSGELLLTGGASRARLLPGADANEREHYFRYQIDPTGSGYGPLQRARWRLVTDGALFGWDPNAKPEITSLTLSPASPRRGDTITALVEATDLDGDTLEYSTSWVVGLDWVASDTMQLAPRFHEKGDVVTFTVRVSDGKATTIASSAVTVVNTPPAAAVEFEPAAPISSEDLVLFPYWNDSDGDAPTISHQWLRNGAPIAGQTGQVLPRSQFAKGDAITALVTLDDGDDQTTAVLTFTIGDTPAEISAPEPPPLNYGDLLTLVITATDYDASDALPGFVLTHGPAGMTVDRDTGILEWTVSGPLFGEYGQAAWGVALDVPGGAAVEGVIGFDALGREYPLMRTGLHAPLPHGLVAGDFDDDGDDEALVIGGGTVYELSAGNGGYRQSWAFPFSYDDDSSFVAVAAADVDGADGRAEIFIANHQSLLELDGVERRFVQGGSVSGLWGVTPRDVAVADLDGDGRTEFVFLETLNRGANPALQSRLSIRREGFYRVLDPSDFGSAVDIGNVDGDAALEIVTGGGYVIDGAGIMSYAPQAVQRPRPEFGWDLEVGDTNGDGIDEIVASLGNGNVTIYAFDAGTQTFGVALTIASADTEALLVADIGGTPAEEIVIGDGPAGGGRVRALRRTGASTVTTLFDVAARGDTVSAIAAADFDDDGAIELLWGLEGDPDMLVVAEASGAVQWTSGDTQPQVASGPFVGGELARTPTDAPAPLFASMRTASSGLRLASLHPQTGDLTFSAELPRPVTDSVQLRVVDYDNDLRDEAFVTSDRDTGAYQLAYDFYGASTEFSSAIIPNEEGATALAYGDLNADGREDLVTTSLTGFIRAYDVFQGAPLFTLQLAPGQVPIAAAIAPLNGSGGPEIVVAASDRLVVFSRDGASAYSARLTSAATYPNLRDLVVADVDGDGAFEIFALHGYPGSHVQRLDGNLTPRGSFNVDWPTSSHLLVEGSAFDRKNLVLLENDSTPVILVVDPDTGKEIWRSPALIGTILRGGLHFVDLAGDGNRQIAIGTTDGVFLTR